MVMASDRIAISKSALSLLGAVKQGHQEILFEGPARTGKSFTLCLFARLWAEQFPGAKILFVRQTRKSLNHSVLTLWEDLFERGHPVLTPPRMKRARDEYVFPYSENEVDIGDGRGLVKYAGESEVHLIGMDNPERLMSTEYDVILVFEATELSLRSWSLAFSRLSNAHMPWNFQVADCNPAEATNWLNLRAEESLMDGDEETGHKKMFRIRTVLQDNPKMWDDERGKWTPVGTAYNKKLDNLPPRERGRLRDGLWISQSGQVFENWRPDRHVVQGKLVQKEGRGSDWWLMPLIADGVTQDFEPRRVAWFGCAFDWGYFPDPGAAALYAVDDQQRAFVVEEYYCVKKPHDWWVKKAVAWQKKFDVRAVVCDGPQEKVSVMNAMLGGKLSVRGHPIAITAEKGPGSILAGIDIVRWCLDNDDSEKPQPRLRYLATAPRVTDGYLVDELLPTGGAQEYPGYVFVEREDGRPNKALPVDLNNHGIDRDRYFMSYLWKNKHYREPDKAAPVTPLDIDIEADLRELRNQQRQRRRR